MRLLTARAHTRLEPAAWLLALPCVLATLLTRVSPFGQRSGALSSASMLCTMHSATKHCGLRAKGGKRLKAPRNEELYKFLFKPSGRLHRALADCRVTLASYVEGHKRRWWWFCLFID